jgi:thermitase
MWTAKNTRASRGAHPSRQIAASALRILAGLAVVVSPLLWAPAFTAQSLGQSPVTKRDAVKAADLERAIANGGVSVDRLVVIYSGHPTADDPARHHVRQLAGAQLLRADTRIARDVLRVPHANAPTIAKRLRTAPGVLDAYADRVASVDLVVNDPLLRKEWGLRAIEAATAWDTSQANGVKVAVLDCGIHALHPDLAGKVVLEHNFTASPTTDDLCNHGTHVAGTVGAMTNNNVGVAGVAPGAALLNGKVLSDGGSGFFSSIDTAIEWAADNGAKVISMSLGAATPCPSGTQAAANYAWSKGAVIVAAAGNSAAEGAMAPANCGNVVGVAASDQHDTMAVFSNYGAEVDVAAPGVTIQSTVNPLLNTGKEYASFSGTSMATPHAAGVLSLIWAANSGASPSAVRDRLFTTADPVAGTGISWTYGRINAAAAVAGAIPPTRPEPPASLSAVARSGVIRLTWSPSTTTGVTYTVYRGTSPGGAKILIATDQGRVRYSDRTVASSQLYCYNVTARSPSAESQPSPEACATAR